MNKLFNECHRDVIRNVVGYLSLRDFKRLRVVSRWLHVLLRPMLIAVSEKHRIAKIKSAQFSQRLFNLLTHRHILNTVLPERKNISRVVYYNNRTTIYMLSRIHAIRHVTFMFDSEPSPDTFLIWKIGHITFLQDPLTNLTVEKMYFNGKERYLVHWYPLTYFYRGLICFHSIEAATITKRSTKHIPFYAIIVSGYTNMDPYSVHGTHRMLVRTNGSWTYTKYGGGTVTSYPGVGFKDYKPKPKP